MVFQPSGQTNQGFKIPHSHLTKGLSRSWFLFFFPLINLLLHLPTRVPFFHFSLLWDWKNQNYPCHCRSEGLSPEQVDLSCSSQERGDGTRPPFPSRQPDSFQNRGLDRVPRFPKLSQEFIRRALKAKQKQGAPTSFFPPFEKASRSFHGLMSKSREAKRLPFPLRTEADFAFVFVIFL